MKVWEGAANVVEVMPEAAGTDGGPSRVPHHVDMFAIVRKQFIGEAFIALGKKINKILVYNLRKSLGPVRKARHQGMIGEKRASTIAFTRQSWSWLFSLNALTIKAGERCEIVLLGSAMEGKNADFPSNERAEPIAGFVAQDCML